MEGICKVGGATGTWVAAGCPAIALGATGSKRDPAGTMGNQSVLSGRRSDRHGAHKLDAGGCGHSKQVSPGSAQEGAAALGVTSSVQDPAGTVSSPFARCSLRDTTELLPTIGMGCSLKPGAVQHINLLMQSTQAGGNQLKMLAAWDDVKSAALRALPARAFTSLHAQQQAGP